MRLSVYCSLRLGAFSRSLSFLQAFVLECGDGIAAFRERGAREPIHVVDRICTHCPFHASASAGPTAGQAARIQSGDVVTALHINRLPLPCFHVQQFDIKRRHCEGSRLRGVRYEVPACRSHSEFKLCLALAEVENQQKVTVLPRGAPPNTTGLPDGIGLA